MKKEIEKIFEIKEDVNKLFFAGRGKLVRIVGNFENGEKFKSEGRVYQEFNGQTIQIINYDSKAKEINIDWMNFDKKSPRVIICDYKGNSYPKSMFPETYQELLREWGELEK